MLFNKIYFFFFSVSTAANRVTCENINSLLYDLEVNDIPNNYSLSNVYNKSEILLELCERIADMQYPEGIPQGIDLSYTFKKMSECPKLKSTIRKFCIPSTNTRCPSNRNYKYSEILFKKIS